MTSGIRDITDMGTGTIITGMDIDTGMGITGNMGNKFQILR